jgi:hypothetical protein
VGKGVGMRDDIKKLLSKKELFSYWVLFSFGFIVLFLPWAIIMLAITFILSPMFLILGEAPDWFISLRDITTSEYYFWLNKKYRLKAVKNKNGGSNAL